MYFDSMTKPLNKLSPLLFEKYQTFVTMFHLTSKHHHEPFNFLFLNSAVSLPVQVFEH